MGGEGTATGACHDTTAAPSLGVARPMIGGGSATQADNPNAPTPTANTARPTRHRRRPRPDDQPSNRPRNRAISTPDRSSTDRPYDGAKSLVLSGAYSLRDASHFLRPARKWHPSV